MNDTDRFGRILEEIEFLAAERRRFAVSGPHLIFQSRSEEIGRKDVASVSLLHRSRPFPMHLSLRGRMFVHFMAKRRHLSLTAAEIEQGIKDLYANQITHGHAGKRTPIIGRRMVKVYVRRTRKELGRVFRVAGLKANPSRVLISERSEVNQTLYRLRCTAEWRNESEENSPGGLSRGN